MTKLLCCIFVFKVLLCFKKYLVRSRLSSFYLKNYQITIENLLKIENNLRFILNKKDIFSTTTVTIINTKQWTKNINITINFVVNFYHPRQE